MMNLSFLSPKTIACIARGAVSLEQCYHHYEWGNHYQVRVTYPNGLGALIELCRRPECGEADVWEVSLLKGGKLYIDSDGMDFTWSDLAEEDVIWHCSHIYSFA